MTHMLSRLALAVVAVLCLDASAFARSRDLSIDDITRLEAFGRGAISPAGDWAVYEKRGAYASIPRFDLAQRSAWIGMQLWRVDLGRPDRPPERLLASEPTGVMRGAFSPSGARLLVYRFDGDRLEPGVVSMADGSVWWTGVQSELPAAGSAAQWLSDTELVLMIRPDGSPPALLRYFSGGKREVADAWRRTAAGETASRTILDARDGVVSTPTPTPEQALIRVEVGRRHHDTLLRGRIADFSLSPDRTWLVAVTGAEPNPITPGPILQADPPVRQRLKMIRMKDGERFAPAQGLDVAPHLLRWSADSGAVLVWARRDSEGWAEGALKEVRPGGVRPLDRRGLSVGDGAAVLRGVRAEWMAETPVLYARPASGARFDWYALTGDGPPTAVTAALASAPARIAAVDVAGLSFFADGGFWSAGGEGLRRLGLDDATVRAAVDIDPERTPRLAVNDAPRQAWVAAFGDGGRSLVLGTNGGARWLEGAAESVRLLAASDKAALVLERTELVETLRLRTPTGDYPLDQVNGDLGGVALIDPVDVPHRDAWGRPAVSRLFLPSGAVKGLIVKVYPGTVESGAWSGPLTLTYGTRSEVLAGAGYAVLSPAIPIDLTPPDRGAFYRRSVDLAVDAALAAHPDLPANRMAILGHSFGGYAALAIAARSDRYRTYVASSAITDLFGEWGEFDASSRIMPEEIQQIRNQQGWVEAGQGDVAAPPFAAAERYAAESPWLGADQIQAPVLLITADRDYIPMSQSERVFSALYRQGGRARLITYWGEHHAVWSPANIRDRYRQIFNWLEATLPSSPKAAADGAPRRAPNPRRRRRP